MTNTGIQASGSFGKESGIFKITREVERFVRTASQRIGAPPVVSLAATVERLKPAGQRPLVETAAIAGPGRLFKRLPASSRLIVYATFAFDRPL
ncbi:hypothetical protein [Pandoraea horticolens]|uniref:hypothetical protein n=1 Tax=Pandoraea horticolens TaxID=2508298 RepID=UPI0012415881|nr:hypothetical protein [Pandoraea horticolens]